MAKVGLQSKLFRVFFLQVLLISVAIILGIFVSAKVFEDILVKKALEGEAAHFWQRFEENSSAPRPDTMNLLGFVAVDGDIAEIPVGLRDLQPGYRRVPLNGKEPLVYVEDRGATRLYLVFDEEQVSNLSFYFGIIPLSVALIIVYLLSWFSYRQSRRAVSPIIQLAHKVESFDFKHQRLGSLDLSEFGATPDMEVKTLLDALDRFTERLEDFIEREKDFTRDASHEMRTPLAVIKSSVALLDKSGDLSAQEKRAVALIKQTVADMESLIETLLLLAREEFSALPQDDIVINDLVADVSSQVERAVGNDAVSLAVEEKCLLSIRAPEKVLNILFSNLIRNAFSYTPHGEVLITIDEGEVSIKDSGIGMEEKVLENVYKPFFRAQPSSHGHGLGLSIVKRFCNRFGWTLKMVSKPGGGTEVMVLFPEARRIGHKRDLVDQ